MSESVIKPTVGRVVWFYPGRNLAMNGTPPFVALIAHVHSDRCVNLAIFDSNGRPQTAPPTSVTMVQPGEKPPADEPYCEWMPYQQRKTFGSESGEKAAGKEAI